MGIYKGGDSVQRQAWYALLVGTVVRLGTAHTLVHRFIYSGLFVCGAPHPPPAALSPLVP